MSDQQQLIDTLEQRFEYLIGISTEALLQNISADAPSGDYLKYEGVYAAIQAARQSDDASVPMGQWEHDLNTADWEEVNRLAVDALLNKSKDLQIAIWLLEAQIHINGFAAIGPCFYYMLRLCNEFWETLYPEIDEDGDLDYRTNLIVWANDKLLPVLKMIPLTHTRSDQSFTWADWEMAAHYEQLPADRKKELGNDYLQTQSIVTAVIATPIEFYRDVFDYIVVAVEAIDGFSATLDEKCQEESPTLSAFRGLLVDIYETLYSHVKHRGLTTPAEAEDVQEQPEMAADQYQPPSNSGPINSRSAAYAQLAEAAEYLAQDDPHSPVPYLVYKAIEWGQLNTAELYQELFVQYQGQLNIFEILGLELDQKNQKKTR